MQIPDPSFGYATNTTLSTNASIQSIFEGSQPCSLDYNSIRSADTLERMATPASITPEVLNCTLTDFSNINQKFEVAIQNLADTSNTPTSALRITIEKAEAYVVSDAWVACTTLVDQNLMDINSTSFSRSSLNCFSLPRFSPAWNTDGCCNAAMVNFECCAPHDTSISSQDYSYRNGSVEALNCLLPDCIKPLVQDYAKVASSVSNAVTGCTSISDAALNDARFNTNPYPMCYYSVLAPPSCTTDANCQTLIGNLSVCQASGYQSFCTIPCTADSDCGVGECQLLGGTSGTCIVPGFANPNSTQYFADCIFSRLDQYVAVYLKEAIELDDPRPNIDLNVKFADAITDGGCVNEYGAPWLGSSTACDQKCCNSQLSICNWSPCTINGTGFCSGGDKYCLDFNPAIPFPDDGNVCAICTSMYCSPIGNKPFCAVDLTEKSSNWPQETGNVTFEDSYCTGLGFNYNPLLTSLGSSARCYKTATTALECMPNPQDCIGGQCDSKSYCYATDITTQSACSGVLNGYSLQWRTWTYAGVNRARCIYQISSAPSYGGDYELACAAIPSASWVQVFHWNINSGMLTPQTCLGSCSNYTFRNKTACEGVYTCSNCDLTRPNQPPECYDKALCEAKADCSSPGGCLIPVQSYGTPGTTSYVEACSYGYWTPRGCLDATVNPLTCTSRGGSMVARPQDRDTCINESFFCKNLRAPLYGSPGKDRSLPLGYTYDNAAECMACGNSSAAWVPFNSWNSLTWTQAYAWTQYSWIKRGVSSPRWNDTVSLALFSRILNKAKARRTASVLKSELLCKYGKITNLLEPIVCSCSGEAGNDCSSIATSVAEQISGSTTFCIGIDANYTSDFVRISTLNNFSVSSTTNLYCSEITITTVPRSQFELQRSQAFSASAIETLQSHKGEVLYLSNALRVVIGEIVSDGGRWDPTESRDVVTGVRTCFIIDSARINEVDFDVGEIDLVSTTDFKTFTPLKLHIALDTTEACIDQTDPGATYFYAAMVSNWESANLVNTWSPVDLGLMYLGVVLYALLLLFSGYQFYLHVAHSWGEKKFWNLQKIAYILITLFLIDRILYFVLTSVGLLEAIPALSVVFADLPALIFFAVFSLNVFTLQGGGKSRLKIVLIIFNAIVYTAYLVFLLLYFILKQPPHTITNCSNFVQTPSHALTPNDIIALIYKGFFLLICLMLGGAFAFYTIKIVGVLKKSAGSVVIKKSDSKQKKMQRMIIATTICVLSLLAQAINLLVSVFVFRSTTTILIIVLIVETIPALLFLFLFAKENSLVNPVASMKTAYTKSRGKSMATKTTGGQSVGTSAGDDRMLRRNSSLKIKKDAIMANKDDKEVKESDDTSANQKGSDDKTSKESKETTHSPNSETVSTD